MTRYDIYPYDIIRKVARWITEMAQKKIEDTVPEEKSEEKTAEKQDLKAPETTDKATEAPEKGKAALSQELPDNHLSN